jgi:HD-GYP domain-containing protein (c-di-GMP phosphodiesterase class II)
MPSLPLDPDALTRRVAKLSGLLDVAKAMTAARDLDTLLALILREAARVVEADRCSLFLVDREKAELWSRIAQGAQKEIRIPLGGGLAGHVATTGEVVNIPDAYRDPRFNRTVDVTTGYHTHAVMCCPMRDAKGEVVGVIQALNKREGDAFTGTFTTEDEELLLALGGQAASAVENAMLHEEIQRLFEGFVGASVVAIEARDPSTAGHSGRVAKLTVGLAESLARTEVAPYRHLTFTAQEIHELRYASLLHDFGKVGVREHVLIKAEKLFPFEVERVRSRFEVIAQSLEVESYKRRLQWAMELGGAAAQAAIAGEDGRLMAQLQELREILKFIEECNRPSVLARGGFERLGDLGARTFPGPGGDPRPYLTPAEVQSLSLPRGSLTELERKEIESHVTHTVRFLQQIPWTRALRRVPEIAAAHHEKLDGTGYPSALAPERIPVQSRMMAIADIYDALTASDRPYKKAVPHPLALDILGQEAKANKIDRDLLQIFIEAQVPSLLGK